MRIQVSVNSRISDSDNISQAFLRSRSVDHATRETRSNAIEYDLKKSLGNKISGGKIKKKKERKKSDIKARRYTLGVTNLILF